MKGGGRTIFARVLEERKRVDCDYSAARSKRKADVLTKVSVCECVCKIEIPQSVGAVTKNIRRKDKNDTSEYQLCV